MFNACVNPVRKGDDLSFLEGEGIRPISDPVPADSVGPVCQDVMAEARIKRNQAETGASRSLEESVWEMIWAACCLCSSVFTVRGAWGRRVST